MIPMRLILLCALAGVAFSALPPSAPAAEPTSSLSRVTFAIRMRSLKDGMSKAKVRELLGAPDEVRATDERGELWAYGVTEPRGFPSIGAVTFSAQGTSKLPTGLSRNADGFYLPYGFGWGFLGDETSAFSDISSSEVKELYAWGLAHFNTPPGANVIAEAELRRLIKLLAQVPTPAHEKYNPLPLIEAVNALLPLGKEKALLVVVEYLRVIALLPKGRVDEPAVFLVLRLLFERPSGAVSMPTPQIGVPDVAPAEAYCMPRFPLVVIHDLPLLAVGRYALRGVTQPALDHASYFNARGLLRARPLTPPDDPTTVLEDAPRCVKEWLKSNDAQGTRKAQGALAAWREQIARVLLTAFDGKIPTQGGALRAWCAECETHESRWNALVRWLASHRVAWDAKENRYKLLGKRAVT